MLEERNKKKAGSKDKVVLRELCRITSTATRTFGPLDAADDGEAATQHLIAIKEKVGETIESFVKREKETDERVESAHDFRQVLC